MPTTEAPAETVDGCAILAGTQTRQAANVATQQAQSGAVAVKAQLGGGRHEARRPRELAPGLAPHIAPESDGIDNHREDRNEREPAEHYDNRSPRSSSHPVTHGVRTAP
jgi:hypothetical protein